MTTVGLIFEKHMTIIEKLPNYDTENEIFDLFISFSSWCSVHALVITWCLHAHHTSFNVTKPFIKML